MPLSGDSAFSTTRATTRVLLILSLMVSVPAFALCQEPPAPIFPKGVVDNPQTMDVLQSKMQSYVKMTEDYLDCLDPEQRKQKMDEALATMKQVTSDYNALTVAYRKLKADQLLSESVK